MSVCNDLIHTLCSPLRVASLLKDSASNSPTALNQVGSWSKAVSTALEKLCSDKFSSLSDVVKPFTLGLREVTCSYIKFCYEYILSHH